jgi:hypothetical protein
LVQSWFCCTQQRSVVMIRRHWEGEQQALVPVDPGMQRSPARVQSLQTPPEHELPAQQSESAVHDCPRLRHVQRPPEQSIEPQQSALLVHMAPAAAQAQRPPMQAAPLQQSAFDAQGPLAGLQQVPVVPPVFEVHAMEMPPAPGQQRTPEVPVEHICPGLAHMVPAIWQVPPRHSIPIAQSALLEHRPPVVLRVQRPIWHESWPQHSWLVRQVPFSARQQRLEPWACAHIVPLAHIVIPGVQSPPAGMGVIPSLQVPALQARPGQHGAIAEHAVPAPLQR